MSCCPSTPIPIPNRRAPDSKRPVCARTLGQIIRDCLNASDDHAVLFVGSGCTGAIDRMLRVLGLDDPTSPSTRRYGLTDHIPEDERPVVFIGPFEHHSNELPWRESIADVSRLARTATDTSTWHQLGNASS